MLIAHMKQSMEILERRVAGSVTIIFTTFFCLSLCFLWILFHFRVLQLSFQKDKF